MASDTNFETKGSEEMKLFGVTILALASAQEINNDNSEDSARQYNPDTTEATLFPRRTLPPPATCWKCDGKNFGLCLQQHYIRYGYNALTCPLGQICSMVERRREGKIEWVSMQCKDEDVCKHEQEANLRPWAQLPTATNCHQMKVGR